MRSLDVTIGDVSKKRAGKYEDVITIRITAAAAPCHGLIRKAGDDQSGC